MREIQPPEKEELIRFYQKTSYAAVARRYNVSEVTAKKWLINYGCKLKSWKDARWNGKKEIQKGELERLISIGKTSKEISIKLKTSRSTVFYNLAKYGIKIQKSSDKRENKRGLPPKDELRRSFEHYFAIYRNDILAIDRMAWDFKTSEDKMENWLHHFGIRTRDPYADDSWMRGKDSADWGKGLLDAIYF